MTNETTASQPKSIGDDAQFQRLLTAWDITKAGSNDCVDTFNALVTYIDSRAPAAQASATIQAAPKTSFDDYWWEARHQVRTQKEHARQAWDFALKSAATIQEPAMVAEPDNRSLKQAPDLGQSEASIRSWLQAHGYGNVTPLHVLNDLSSRIAKFTAVPIVAESVVNGQAQTITINGRQLQDALDAAWPDRADKDQGDTEITLFMRPAPGVDGEGGLLPAGLYLYWTEYPDEGCSWLNPDSELAPAAPMVADPAGVVRQALIDLRELHISTLRTPTNFNAYTDIIDKALAATVKAVPSEAQPLTAGGAVPEGWETWDSCMTGVKPWFWLIPANQSWKDISEAMQLELNSLRQVVRTLRAAAPLADKTGGGE